MLAGWFLAEARDCDEGSVKGERNQGDDSGSLDREADELSQDLQSKRSIPLVLRA